MSHRKKKITLNAPGSTVLAEQLETGRGQGQRDSCPVPLGGKGLGTAGKERTPGSPSAFSICRAHVAAILRRLAEDQTVGF